MRCSPTSTRPASAAASQFELFRPAAQEKMAEFYAELPISIRITGNYHDMGAFASDVAQLPRIVTLNDLAITNDKGVLAMEADRARRSAISTRRRSRSSARSQARRPRKRARNDPSRRLIALLGALASRAAAARATRTCARGCPSRARTRAASSTRCRRSSPTSRSPTTRSTCPIRSSRARSSPPRARSKLAPDLTRRKEPLEAYPLESLTMVGTLERNKADVSRWCARPTRTSTRSARATTSGQNFGVITGIGDSEIKLKELVQDSAGDWTERSEHAAACSRPRHKAQERR